MIKINNFIAKIDDEKNIRSVSKSKSNIVIRYDDYTQNELLKRAMEYDSPIHLGLPVLELSKILMYNFFYEVLGPTFKYILLHYTDTDSFALIFTSGFL